MISCTEFILSYNELFAFLDRRYGRSEVDKLWDYLFKPTGKGIPLMELEARCTDQYALCRRQIVNCGAEWNTSPAIVD